MAVATISDIRTRMAAILDEYITTLETPDRDAARTHRYLPRQLNAAELPAFVILPGEATHTEISQDEEESSRLFLMRLYIAPTEHGVAGEVEERAEIYVDDVRRYLNRLTRLELDNQPLSGIRRAWIESDRGIREVRYPDNEEAPWYLFVEFRWRVISRRNRK